MSRRPMRRGRGAVRPIMPARRLAGAAMTGAATADEIAVREIADPIAHVSIAFQTSTDAAARSSVSRMFASASGPGCR